jgi:hypothetical protein
MLMVLHQQMGLEGSNGGVGQLEDYYTRSSSTYGVQLTCEQMLGTRCWFLQFHQPGGMGLAVQSSTP